MIAAWLCWLSGALGGTALGWGLRGRGDRRRREAIEAYEKARWDQARSELDAAMLKSRSAAREVERLRTEVGDLQQEALGLRSRVSELEPLFARASALSGERNLLLGKLAESEARLAQVTAEYDQLAARPVRTVETLVDRVVEKRVEVPVERIVEKRVEVPVEKIVERRIEIPVDRVIEKRVEVPVEQVVYRDRPARRAASRKRRPDDLKRIHGIGPVLEKFLNRRKVYWFRQIARWTSRDIARFEAELPNFQGRIAREGWVKSARQEHLKQYGRDPLRRARAAAAD